MTSKKTGMPIIAILHNIRSAHNVGSIFRTADAVGVLKIYLTGYTPAPLDRFGRAVKEIAKTALGAEKFVEWEKSTDIKKVLSRVSKEGFEICAIEQSPKSVSYINFKNKKPIALVLGNEVSGLSRDVISLADCVLEIPMRGKKESLNVGVAFGVVAFSVRENQ